MSSPQNVDAAVQHLQSSQRRKSRERQQASEPRPSRAAEPAADLRAMYAAWGYEVVETCRWSMVNDPSVVMLKPLGIASRAPKSVPAARHEG